MKRIVVTVAMLLVVICVIPTSSFAMGKGGWTEECIDYNSPVAGADTYLAEAGSPLEISAIDGVLGNDQSQQTPPQELMSPAWVSAQEPFYTVYETQSSWLQIGSDGSLVFSPPFWLSGTVNYYYPVSDIAEPYCPGLGQLSFVVEQPNQAGTPIKLAAKETVLNTFEGDRGTYSQISINFVLSRPRTRDVTFLITTTAGTATERADYIKTAGYLRIPAGETSVSRSLTIVGDSRFEGNETFTLNLSLPSTGVIIDGPTTTVTINNDD